MSGPDGNFKHKYLTQTTTIYTDALLRAANNICNTLANIASATNKTRRAIDYLTDILKGQANKNEYSTNTQRVGMEAAQSERIITDKSE